MKKTICGIEVDVEKRNVKSVRIKIDRDLRVSLIVPIRCSEKVGIDFFIAKEQWVKQKLSKKQEKRQIEIKNGESLFVLGKPFSVVIVPSRVNKGVINGNQIVFYTNAVDNDVLKKQYEKLLKEILLFKAEEIFDKWEQKTGLKKASLTIRKTVSRWGSCNSFSGAINLSLYLACLPEFCLDYVVLHELCHLRYSNHGEKFKQELHKYMPNWKDVCKFMKDNSNQYLYK